ADGDTSTATLIVSLGNSDVTVNLPSVEDTGTIVSEAGLAAGSNAAADSETTTGSFSFAAADGPATISVNGNTVAAGDTVTGTYGTLTITSIAAGTVAYTYTLDGATNGDNTAESFAIQVVDADADIATGDLTINIVDDEPQAGDFLDLAVNQVAGSSASGTNSGFISGADGWQSIDVVGPEIEGIYYGSETTGEGDSIATTLTGYSTESDTAVFTLEVDASGNYEFTLLSTEAGSITNVTLTGVVAAGPTGSYSFGEGDNIVEVTTTDGSQVNTSTNGLAVDNQNFDDGESLTFLLPEITNGVGFSFNVASNVKVAVSIVDVDGVARDLGEFAADVDGNVVVNSQWDFQNVTLTSVNTPSNTKVEGISLIENILAQEQELAFTVNGVDNDGDPTSTSVTVMLTADGEVTSQVGVSNDAVADEDDLPIVGTNDSAPGDQDTVSTGTISFNLGSAALASIALATSDDVTGLTTLDGTEIVTSWDAANNTLLGYKAGTVATTVENQVFTVELTDIGAGSANYNVTLLQPVSHPQNNVEDDLSFDVTVAIFDDTGAQVNGSFSLTIDDDSPAAAAFTQILAVPVSDTAIGELTAGWENVTATSGNGSVTTSEDADGIYLQWGGNNGSGYDFVLASELTGGNEVATDARFSLGTLTHNNYPISLNSALLATVDMEVSFTLLIDGVPTEVTTTVGLTHTETPNSGASSDPANDDIIEISNPDQVQVITVGGREFLLSIRGFMDSDGNLVTTARTTENDSTSFELVAEISSTDDLPEVSGIVAPEFGADGAAVGAVVTWENNGDTVSSGVIEGSFGSLTVAADGSYTYSMSRSGRDSMEDNVAAEDVFTYYSTDGDGDTVASTLTLSLQGVANTADGSPTPLLATDGDDIFAFALSEEGDVPADAIISGFGDSGNDVLDLRDLLQGEEAEGADLTNYLNVTFDGTDSIIEVSVNGGFNTGALADQTITMEGIDLVGVDDLASVIQGMLDSGKLSLDQ
ncbi:hypothetical protein CWI75_15305, partial [Kineobactrum sediminis]